ncbi:MAG: SynChlorMet cassette radical SAM/SPASM protein ScmF [Victivallaceae bacterium]|nr:SynChlorMet cassette radical SAM/SPASM protein ScmF [Victivallaceae bacterium]
MEQTATKTGRPPLPECGYYLNSLYFYITEGCNLRCSHCWINPPFEKDNRAGDFPYVDLKLFKHIVSQAKALGAYSVKLSGGEPLIHPEIHEILDYIKAEDLRLAVETNATVCTPELARKIKECRNSFVSTSLDGPDAATHERVRGVKGCFGATLQGLRYLVEADLNPQIIMAVMRHNRDKMEALVRLAESEKAGSVKFTFVTSSGRENDIAKDKNKTLTIEEIIETGKWIEKELIPSSEISIVYSHPMAFKTFKKAITKGSGSCGIFGVIGILGSGKYALCGIGQTILEMVFGDAGTDKLADIWNHNPLINEIREKLPRNLKGICADCIFRKKCLGSCIAMNYNHYRDLMAPNWFCQEAHSLGLFPERCIIPGSKSEYPGKNIG